MNQIPNEVRVGRTIVIPKRLNSRKNQKQKGLDMKAISVWSKKWFSHKFSNKNE